MATAALKPLALTRRMLIGASSPEDKIRFGVSLISRWTSRSADMNKTPDVRTRAFLPEWVAEVDIRFNANVQCLLHHVTAE